MAPCTRKIGSATLARRIASCVATILLLSAAAAMQPGSAARADTRPTMQSETGREVALLVPRRIRLIINYHKPSAA